MVVLALSVVGSKRRLNGRSDVDRPGRRGRQRRAAGDAHRRRLGPLGCPGQLLRPLGLGPPLQHGTNAGVYQARLAVGILQAYLTTSALGQLENVRHFLADIFAKLSFAQKVLNLSDGLLLDGLRLRHLLLLELGHELLHRR